MATKKKTPKEKNADQPETKAVRIKRNVPTDMLATFANNFVVRHTVEGDEFQLFFFQIEQPIVTDADELPKDIDFVEAKCVGRFVITKERMRQLIAAMAENYARCQVRLGATGEEKNNATEDEKASAGKKQAG